MQTNYIKKLLNIQGVLVKNVKTSQNSIDIFVETPKKYHNCPCCNAKTNYVHDYRTQKVQHIKISNIQSFIFLKKRRYICHCCNKKFYEDYSFLTKYFRKSNSVFFKVVEDLKQLKNFKTIAYDNNISIPTTIRFMKYHIFMSGKHSLIPLPKRIGIDEFKGNCNNTKYQFHIFDLDTHKTIDIVSSRAYNSLESFFSKYSSEERKLVEFVSMDLYNPFKRIIKDKFPSAIIVADCFHFTRIVSNSLDELRLKIWRDSSGIEKKYFKFLKHSLMKDASSVNEHDKQKLLYAFEFSPILKYGYTLYQEFLQIKKLPTYEEKESAFRHWLLKAETSTIPEFNSSTKTLRQWHEYISNAFKYNISNGPVEGKNNLIKTLKRISFGFKKLSNFRDRILLLELN